MKKLINLSGVKALTKTEQKSINGGQTVGTCDPFNDTCTTGKCCDYYKHTCGTPESGTLCI